jgi:rSAM/selenodomain-associated transferase 2
MPRVKISIIIPAYNEAETISHTVAHLKGAGAGHVAEIIVSDGGSTDTTMQLAQEAGAVALLAPVKGRAGQMNHGVKHATGDVYYFVHADSRPPQSFATDIMLALQQGYNCGSYRFRFDSDKFLLKINAFFTRFNFLFFRGGDQSIFVTKELFDSVGAFKEEMLIMEDYDFLARIWQKGRFKLIPKATVVSARKYDANSWLRVQLANLKVVRMYRRGATQQDMLQTYKQALSYRKNAF